MIQRERHQKLKVWGERSSQRSIKVWFPGSQQPAGKDGPQTQVTKQQSCKLLGNQIWPDSQSDCL